MQNRVGQRVGILFIRYIDVTREISVLFRLRARLPLSSCLNGTVCRDQTVSWCFSNMEDVLLLDTSASTKSCAGKSHVVVNRVGGDNERWVKHAGAEFGGALVVLCGIVYVDSV